VLRAAGWHIPEKKIKQKHFQKYYHKERLDLVSSKTICGVIMAVNWMLRLHKQI